MAAVDYAAIVEGADELPDAAIIPDPAAAMLMGISIWTLRRRNPVPPIQITPFRRGRRMGDIRRLGRSAQPVTT
ncbi:MAG: hypothetical protein J2P54_06230 [Bradyrhizobiaceae bacterium]|nr:hypothetical protein [Bradyrhizobiaceae bacterium]